MTIAPNQLQIFLDVATEAALAAGTILQQHWGNLESVEEKGRSGDLVTIADRVYCRTDCRDSECDCRLVGNFCADSIPTANPTMVISAL